MIPTRCPEPSGTRVSSARTPVCSAWLTRLRSNGFGAAASSGTD
jgi:hypothetical protein